MNKWDLYFLKMCNVVSENSECLSRKVGAVIVLGKTLISTGYNGPPRGVPHCSERYTKDKKLIDEIANRGLTAYTTMCPRRVLGYKSGEGLEWCPAGHGERNAIVNAAREGLKELKGTTMYMNCAIPCTPCLVEIINAGIKEIVVTSLGQYDLMTDFLLKESGIMVRTYEV